MLAVAIFAENPKLGVSLVIFSPTVLITLWPKVASPKTIPTPPKSKIRGFITDVEDKSFELTAEKIAARGPIAFATSFEP